MEAELLKVFVQYGALGGIAVYLIYKDYFVSKKLFDALTEIKEMLGIAVAQNKLFEETLLHERGVSKKCFEEVLKKLDEYFHRLKEDK